MIYNAISRYNPKIPKFAQGKEKAAYSNLNQLASIKAIATATSLVAGKRSDCEGRYLKEIGQKS